MKKNNDNHPIYTRHSLFDLVQPNKSETEQKVAYTRDMQPKIENKDRESNKDGIISRYHPDDLSDRFIVVMNGREYATKFYDKKTDTFTGASMLGIYNCNQYFDRSILPDYEDGNYFMKGANKNE